MATRTIRRAKSGATALPPVRKTIPHVDLDEDFSDVSGDPGTEFTLVDSEGATLPPAGDGEYRYMFADKNDSQFGPAYWKRAIPPYEIVHFDGSVSIKGMTFADGDVVESRDLVLMRANRGLKEKRERYERHKTQIENRRLQRQANATLDLSSEDQEARAEEAARARASMTGFQREV